MRRTVSSLTSKSEDFFGFSRYKEQQYKSKAPDAVRQMLLMLTPAHREVVVLYLVDRLSPEEISCELCIPIKTVYSRMHSAKVRLRKNAIYFKKML